MIDCNIFSIKCQRFIGSELISIENSPFLGMTFYLSHKSFSRHIINKSCIDFLPFLSGMPKTVTFPCAPPQRLPLRLSTICQLADVTFNLSRKFTKLFLQIVTYFLLIFHIFSSYFTIIEFKIFRSLICWNHKTKIMEYLQIIFQFYRTIFKKLVRTFEAIIFDFIKMITSTFWTLKTMNRSFYLFFHNQAHFLAWSGNKSITKLNIFCEKQEKC